MRYQVTGLGGRGERAAVRSWRVQSSALVPDPGTAVSSPSYRADGWYDAPARSTVMAALVEAGEYPELFHSDNMAAVDRARFAVPWWYRTAFQAVGPARTSLHLTGVIHAASVFVNGALVAGPDVVAGAYPSTSIDITRHVVRGLNALALEVLPGSPMTDLSTGWVDWNQWPPDNNMGIFRDVLLHRHGDVRLAAPHVVAEPLLPGLERAEVSVAVPFDNLADEPRQVSLRCVVSGNGATIEFGADLEVEAGASGAVLFTPEKVPALSIDSPAVWWPAAEGAQPLYDLEVTAFVEGGVSDRAAATFGVRTVTSEILPGEGRQF
ncbi:MAG TPA: hypothetical protein VGS21_11695, partial [Acidimicrobiales bacterium]|nr:hypothetical protein [Acidimicrobiales bacterium]